MNGKTADRFEEWYEQGQTDWHSPKEIARMAWNECARQAADIPLKHDAQGQLDSTVLYQSIKELESDA